MALPRHGGAAVETRPGRADARAKEPTSSNSCRIRGIHPPPHSRPRHPAAPRPRPSHRGDVIRAGTLRRRVCSQGLRSPRTPPAQRVVVKLSDRAPHLERPSAALRAGQPSARSLTTSAACRPASSARGLPTAAVLWPVGATLPRATNASGWYDGRAAHSRTVEVLWHTVTEPMAHCMRHRKESP